MDLQLFDHKRDLVTTLTPAHSAATVRGMDPIESWLNAPRITLEQRIRAFLEIFLLSGLVSSFFTAILLPFGSLGQAALFQDASKVVVFVLLEALITFLLLGFILRLDSGSLQDLGLRWAEWKPNVLIGICLVPLLFLISMVIATAFRFLLPAYAMERNPLMEIIRTPRELGLFLISVLIAGGIKEELQRVFILKRFQRYLGGARMGLILWSIAFGLAHYVQGAEGMVIAGLFGFIFGAIYLARENIIAPIVAHGLYDVAALLGYWFTQSMSK